MPRYEYECYTCGHRVEHVCKIAERPERMSCCSPYWEGGLPCPGWMRQIITPTSIQVDDIINIPWLQDFAAKRKEARFGGRPIQTRQEYKKYLKDHDLRPTSGENLSEV